MKEANLLRRMGYRPAEVAAGTGFSLRTIQRRIADGELVAHRCGAAVIVYPEDLRAWLDAMPRVDVEGSHFSHTDEMAGQAGSAP